MRSLRGLTRKGCNQFIRRQDRVRERRTINSMSRMHCLTTKSSRCIAHECNVVPELHAEPCGRLDAGIGDHTDDDDLLNIVLFDSAPQLPSSTSFILPEPICDALGCFQVPYMPGFQRRCGTKNI